MLADQARDRLTPERFGHTLGTTHAAVALAFRHGLDPWAAAAAALAHDGSKSLSPEQIEADLDRLGAPLAEEDRPFPAIWHAIHAAQTARAEWEPVETDRSEPIAEAIELHSTADALMGPLARALFVADYTEPGRNFEGVDQLRDQARSDLDEGFRRCLASKCKHLKSRGMALSPRARRAAEFYDVAL